MPFSKVEKRKKQFIQKSRSLRQIAKLGMTTLAYFYQVMNFSYWN